VNFNSANAFHEQGKKLRARVPWHRPAAQVVLGAFSKINAHHAYFSALPTRSCFCSLPQSRFFSAGQKRASGLILKIGKSSAGFNSRSCRPAVSAAAILFPVGNSLAYALATFVRRCTHAAAVATFQTGGRCLVSAPRSAQQLTLLLINHSRASGVCIQQRKASLF